MMSLLDIDVNVAQNVVAVSSEDDSRLIGRAPLRHGGAVHHIGESDGVAPLENFVRVWVSPGMLVARGRGARSPREWDGSVC